MKRAMQNPQMKKMTGWVMTHTDLSLLAQLSYKALAAMVAMAT